MGAPVFISYSHKDQAHDNWRARLEDYLAQARREGGLDPWDDQRIEVGCDWRAAIRQALEEAQAAILLMGPGFLSSAFIADQELPPLLIAARTRGLPIFPLIVRYCDYAGSVLESFQPFNRIEQPLESLPMVEQNLVLNNLSIAVSKAVEHRQGSRGGGPRGLRTAMTQLLEQMDLSRVAFESQNARCGRLVMKVTERLNVTEDLQFEPFLFRFHERMTPEEQFAFAQIRAVTDGPIADCNRRMLQLLLDKPALLDEVPVLTALRQHLVFWLSKYERVFRATPAMAVCYVAREDGVPWPSEAADAVRNRLAVIDGATPDSHPRAGRQPPTR